MIVMLTLPPKAAVVGAIATVGMPIMARVVFALSAGTGETAPSVNTNV